MAKKKGILNKLGRGIKKVCHETTRVIDQSLGLANKALEKTKIDKILGGGSVGISTSSGARGGHNVYYQPKNTSTTVGVGLSNNTGSSSVFVNNQVTMPLATPPAQFSVTDKIAERDQQLREVYGPGYIPESSLATMGVVAVGAAAKQLAADTIELVDACTSMYSFNEAVRMEALTKNVERAVNVSQLISDVASNPSIIPMYYKQRTQDAANAFALAYDQGNLFGAGIATGQTLYDISNAAAMATGVINFGTKAATGIGKNINNFVAAHDFKPPMAFQFDYARLNSGVPLDAVKLQSPVAAKAASIAEHSARTKPIRDSGKVTKGQIVDYLQNIDKIPFEQLIKDLDSLGFELLQVIPEQNIYKFSHVRNELRGTGKAKANLKSSKIMVELHCDATSGPHMHITDGYGNVYDKNLNNLTAKFKKENPGLAEKVVEKRMARLPEAHIKINEFIELNFRPVHD